MTRGADQARDLRGLAVAGAVVCCGLPLLLAIGGGVTLAGLGLRSWLLVVAGVVAAVAGAIRWRQRPQQQPCDAERDQQ